MRYLAVLLVASSLSAQDAPHLLATADDLTRTQQWAAQYPWAQAVIDSVINNAKGWPQSYLSRYALPSLGIPPEGGQWTQWYVCPTHGVSLTYTAPNTHTCPIDKVKWTGWPYDQVIYSRRHSDLANYARDLALAFRWTGTRSYAEQSAWILKQYAAKYPAYPIHDVNNRTATSGARCMAQTLDEAVWLIPIAWAYDLLAGTDVLTLSERQQIEAALLRMAAAVIQRNDMGASNWQSWHNGAIGAVGFALGDQNLINTAIDGKSGFRFQMKSSVLPEGFWFEGAWSYHFYALDPLLSLAEMAARAGVDLYSYPSLHEMFSAPLQLAFPNGRLPAFNDSGEVNLYSDDKFYELAWARYNETPFAAILGHNTRSLNALLWGAAEFPKSDIANGASRSFPVSGYTTLRAPGNDHTIIVKYGPHGGGHGHYDKLNFVSFFNGATMGIDPGTQSYAAPTHATWDQLTIAHNTVTVDQATQSQATGSLIWDDLTHDVYRAVKASAGPAYKQANLTRTLLLTNEYALDVFDAQSTDGKDHRYDWAYHNAGRLPSLPGATAYSAFPASNGYQNLSKTEAAATDVDWQVTFDATPPTPFNYGGVYTSANVVSGSFQVSDEQSFAGHYAGKATYDFRGSGYLLFSTPTLTNVPSTAPQGLSAWVYGDGSGSILNLRMNDATDERFVATFGPIDWTGWKRIEVTQLDTWAHYLGNNDGIFDGPVKTVSLELWPSASGPKSGAIYVDDIRIAYADGDVLAADFEQPQRHVRVWMLADPATTVVTGNGLGPVLTTPVPFVMARRTGRASAFVSLIEPYANAPSLVQFSRAEDGTFTIQGATFTDTFSIGPAGIENFTRLRSGEEETR
jgi:hypothetical protein